MNLKILRKTRKDYSRYVITAVTCQCTASGRPRRAVYWQDMKGNRHPRHVTVDIRVTSHYAEPAAAPGSGPGPLLGPHSGWQPRLARARAAAAGGPVPGPEAIMMCVRCTATVTGPS
jgi:hypothetical protein